MSDQHNATLPSVHFNLDKLAKVGLMTPGFNGRRGIPFMLSGGSGTAKTSWVNQVVNDYDGLAETIIVALRELPDFLGMPSIKDGRTRYAHLEWAERVSTAPFSVVFFDELDKGDEDLQAAVLRVILEGVIGEKRTPVTVRFWAAQNPHGSAAGGRRINAALANRLCWLNWEGPDINQVAKHWMGLPTVLGMEPDDAANKKPAKHHWKAEEEALAEVWPAYQAEAVGNITGFLHARPTLLHKEPVKGDTKAHGPWPSRRSWEGAWRVLAGARAFDMNQEEQMGLVGGFVGQAAELEFSSWIREANLPKAIDVLDGKIQWQPDRKRLDIAAAVLNGCAATVAQQGCDRRQERAEMLFSILASNLKTVPDLIVPIADTLLASKLQLRGNKDAAKVYASVNRIETAIDKTK